MTRASIREYTEAVRGRYLLVSKAEKQYLYGMIRWLKTTVRYNLRPALKGLIKGDEIIVTGELKGEGGIHYSKGDF